MSILVYGVLLATVTVKLPPGSPPVARSTTMITQVRVQRASIIRVPPVTPDIIASEPVKWKEKGGPDCIKWSTIAGAMISSRNSLDVVLRGGKRYRIKLSKRCQAADFYSDFYVKTTADGQLCQSRDSIYSRAGGECGIDKFRSLARTK